MRHAKLLGLCSTLVVTACDAPPGSRTSMREAALDQPIDEVAIDTGGIHWMPDAGSVHDDGIHDDTGSDASTTTGSDASHDDTSIGTGTSTDTGTGTGIGTDASHDDTGSEGSGTSGGETGGLGCDDAYDPVCGVDWVTYLNACFADPIEIDRQGPCDDEGPQPPDSVHPPCTTNCAPTVCGDGTTGPDEGCDDGNTTDGDGCSAFCVLETPSVCGDGWTSHDEGCDDGNTTDGDGCSSACLRDYEAPCGNGKLDLGEDCDDGNTDDDDGCSRACAHETACEGPALTPSPDFAPGIRRFCSSHTTGLNLAGFVVGPDACAGTVEHHDVVPGACAEPPKAPVADGGANHRFIDGKTDEWKVTLSLPIAFEKVPVLGKIVGNLGPEWESQFVRTHEINTWLEIAFDSGQLPTVFVKAPDGAAGKWMRAGALVSARRVAESKNGDTIDHKFSIKAWIIGNEVAKSDGRYKSVLTAVTYLAGEGDYGGSTKAKDLLGKPELDDDAPVSVADVTAVIRKKMEGKAMRKKLEEQHSEALAAAGYVWAQAKTEYGCGLGPDGEGGITKVCIVPWCHYDAMRGENNWLGKLTFTIKYTSSGLFHPPVVRGKTYVIGNGSATYPDQRRVFTRNCSRYEVKADTIQDLPYFVGSVYERDGWSIVDENGRVKPTLFTTGAKTCKSADGTATKCFFTTRTLDDDNVIAVFGWQSNQLIDKERTKF